MTKLLHHALRAGRTAPPRPDRLPATTATVLVAGGGGELGSAVLERLLASRHAGAVKVLAVRRFQTALHGLEAVLTDTLADAPQPGAAPLAQTAVVVFDRERRANGREAAFARPLPEHLAVLAAALQARGVAHLIVVLPHAPASLPAALKAGLANLDEHAVAALGFEHVVFVRSAQTPSPERANAWLQRVADAALAQLRLMIAPSNQAVRPVKVAQLVAALAERLPAAPPGTHVVPPELVWQAAQRADPAPLVAAFLAPHEPAPSLRGTAFPGQAFR